MRIYYEHKSVQKTSEKPLSRRLTHKFMDNHRARQSLDIHGLEIRKVGFLMVINGVYPTPYRITKP